MIHNNENQNERPMVQNAHKKKYSIIKVQITSTLLHKYK